MKKEDEQPIVFAYYVKGEFKGWRADSFGTLDKKWPKIYTYSPEQVETIKKNTQQELCKTGTSFMKALLGMPNVAPMNLEGQALDTEVIIDQVSKGEEEKRAWGEFELRVVPFCSRQEWSEMSQEGEEYKKKAFLDNPQEPLEVHKFKTVNQEN